MRNSHRDAEGSIRRTWISGSVLAGLIILAAGAYVIFNHNSSSQTVSQEAIHSTVENLQSPTTDNSSDVSVSTNDPELNSSVAADEPHTAKKLGRYIILNQDQAVTIDGGNTEPVESFDRNKIDFPSLQYLGGGVYKDKHHVFEFIDDTNTCGATAYKYQEVVDADPATIQIFIPPVYEPNILSEVVRRTVSASFESLYYSKLVTGVPLPSLLSDKQGVFFNGEKVKDALPNAIQVIHLIAEPSQLPEQGFVLYTDGQAMFLNSEKLGNWSPDQVRIEYSGHIEERASTRTILITNIATGEKQSVTVDLPYGC